MPASAISANPWLTTPSLPPTREQGKVKDAAPTGVSRASIEAELPTEQSRMRAMRQVEADAPTMGPGVPGPYGAYGPAYGPAYGQAPSHSERSEPLEMPKLNLGNRSPRSASPRNGYESEFDRLIREKLEGQHTDRTHFKNRVQNRAQGHLSWQWQALDALLDGSLAMWEGVRNTGGRLLGMMPDVRDAANCRRVNQAKPIIINLEDEEEKTLPQDPGDEFSDMFTLSAAVREPTPARIPKAEVPPLTPAGREGLTVKEIAEPNPAQASKPKDTASALSVSSKMTSSAAALLGGFASKTPEKADGDGASQPSEKKPIRPGDSKSCVAPSAMKSSAASSLGALFAKQSAQDEETMAPIQEEPEEAKPKTAAPKASGKAKSVVQSTALSSSAAGALGGLVGKARPETPPQDSNAAQATAEPKRSTAAKSVLNQSTVMSSSAAGALGSLLSAKPSEAASGTATPKVPPTGTTPEPKHSGAGAKSVLNQSTVMSSSAAGALGSLISKAKAPSTAPVPEGEASAPVAKSTDVPAKAPQGGSGPVAKAKPKAGQSVISGLNTSSSAAQALGSMLQAKKS